MGEPQLFVILVENCHVNPYQVWLRLCRSVFKSVEFWTFISNGFTMPAWTGYSTVLDRVTSQGATKHREDPTRLSSICNGTFHCCLWGLVACSGRKQWPWQIELSWILQSYKYIRNHMLLIFDDMFLEGFRWVSTKVDYGRLVYRYFFKVNYCRLSPLDIRARHIPFIRVKSLDLKPHASIICRRNIMT